LYVPVTGKLDLSIRGRGNALCLSRLNSRLLYGLLNLNSTLYLGLDLSSRDNQPTTLWMKNVHGFSRSKYIARSGLDAGQGYVSSLGWSCFLGFDSFFLLPRCRKWGSSILPSNCSLTSLAPLSWYPLDLTNRAFFSLRTITIHSLFRNELADVVLIRQRVKNEGKSRCNCQFSLRRVLC
jgi:hypothetical protein